MICKNILFFALKTHRSFISVFYRFLQLINRLKTILFPLFRNFERKPDRNRNMKTLIAYASTHGCTENVAQLLKEKLNSEVELVNLKKYPNPDLSSSTRIIIGGSIHAGQIQRRVKEFCEKNLDIFQHKEIGLFICCMYEGQTAKEQLRNAFPEKLHQFSKTEAIFGGELDFKKMGFINKLVVKKAAGVKESTSNLNVKTIDKFVRKMEKTYQPMFMLI